MSGRLDGRVAVVNGAGRGIGRAIALEFAREGAKVVVNDLGTAASGDQIEPDRANAVAEEIRAGGGEALADGGDIGDLGDAEKMIQSAIDAWGKLDILVNCAGIIRVGSAVDTSPEDFDLTLRVHSRGYYNTTLFAARHWVERGEYGRLINFASGASLVSQPSLLAYSTAKTGVVGFTRSCANALVGYNVTANCIRPSAVSGMVEVAPAMRDQFINDQGGLIRDAGANTPGDPAHVAPLLVFLASAAAGHVTGRLFEGRGGRYVLWSEPHEERVLEADFLSDPDAVYEGLEQQVCAGLSPRDLPMPMAPILGTPDWIEQYGVDIPLWDFESSPS
jgi:NAD(P)-dependent dehydrogenase (short-subunit alcohol dehydrogenase family)